MLGDGGLVRPFLTSSIVPPPIFLNISNATQGGNYLFGYNDFRVIDLRIANVFHRSFAGRREDFLLGILSVVLIAIVSEIIQTVLMRTQRAQISHNRLKTAFVLDEIVHFRNILAALKRKQHGKNSNRGHWRSSHSCLVVSLALLLLATEVFAVYLTQPKKVYTTEHQYNLRGLQPTGTTPELASRIFWEADRKRCITPSMTSSGQSREFSVTACIMREYERNLDDVDSLANIIKVGSWYHRAGSDHSVEFSDGVESGSHQIRTRASIMQGKKGITKGILFDVDDTEDMANAQYLHKYMMYTAVEWNCEQGFEDRSCIEMEAELQKISGAFENRTVVLWEDGDNDARDTVRGYVTTFEIELRRPYYAIQEALRVFAASAVIKEVEGEGYYVDTQSGKEEYGIESLVYEEGRVAGIVLLGCILLGLLLLLIILRTCLQPISLAKMAMASVSDDDNIFTESSISSGESFVGAGRPGVSLGQEQQSSSNLEYVFTSTVAKGT